MKIFEAEQSGADFRYLTRRDVIECLSGPDPVSALRRAAVTMPTAWKLCRAGAASIGALAWEVYRTAQSAGLGRRMEI